MACGRDASIVICNLNVALRREEMLRTPNYSHLSKRYSEDVYEPAEDTFLLLDALESDMQFLHQLRPSLCLEIGTGSGIVLTSLATIIGKSAVYFATDINPRAADCAMETGALNGVDFDVVIDDLGRSMLPRLRGMVDVLLFNPPYVVTPSSEVGSQFIDAAWAGGVDGREVIDKFLPTAVNLMSEIGVFYMVLIDKNKPDEICRTLRGLGLEGEVILKRKAGIENLLIVKFRKSLSKKIMLLN